MISRVISVWRRSISVFCFFQSRAGETHALRMLSASAVAFAEIGCSPTFRLGWKLWWVAKLYALA